MSMRDLFKRSPSGAAREEANSMQRRASAIGEEKAEEKGAEERKAEEKKAEEKEAEEKKAEEEKKALDIVAKEAEMEQSATAAATTNKRPMWFDAAAAVWSS